MNNRAGTTGESSEQTTITIHDDETEFLIRFEQLIQSFSVEFVVAQVEGAGEKKHNHTMQC